MYALHFDESSPYLLIVEQGKCITKASSVREQISRGALFSPFFFLLFLFFFFSSQCRSTNDILTCRGDDFTGLCTLDSRTLGISKCKQRTTCVLIITPHNLNKIMLLLCISESYLCLEAIKWHLFT